MSLDDLPKLIDTVTGSITTCDHIRQIGALLEKGQAPSVSDAIIVLQDLANLRYRYTIERVQQQAIEILSRTWDSPQEAITDLKQARRLIAWTIREYKDIGAGDEGAADEAA